MESLRWHGLTGWGFPGSVDLEFSNRPVRTRMPGGVAGARPDGRPLCRFVLAKMDENRLLLHPALRCAPGPLTPAPARAPRPTTCYASLHLASSATPKVLRTAPADTSVRPPDVASYGWRHDELIFENNIGIGNPIHAICFRSCSCSACAYVQTQPIATSAGRVEVSGGGRCVAPFGVSRRREVKTCAASRRPRSPRKAPEGGDPKRSVGPAVGAGGFRPFC
ncbi:hypothetical protein SAMN05444352_116102 [Pseudomonas japonica]|uniref:Uncharacterized protein n=1 Tax=Pseudomonas japonica TaxID=256466 RepID=A0A239HTH4_9PSED|nr:hypothetical protein SAMN05444352_116102 [Pseudomonas japonica]